MELTIEQVRQRAVEALLDTLRMVRRHGVYGWTAEDWDDARTLIETDDQLTPSKNGAVPQ